MYCYRSSDISAASTKEPRMTSPVFRALLSAGALLALSSTAFSAADDIIKERQACMKSQGAIMGVAVPMVKGEKPYDNAMLQDAIAKSEAACANWNSYWTQAAFDGATMKHYAKPEVVTDTATLEKVSGAAYGAMQALKATADEAAFKAAFPAVGAGCQGCHEAFRLPKE
jgi:cytochrome c556